MTGERCDNCRNYDPINDSTGICREGPAVWVPPHVDDEGAYHSGDWQQPEMRDDGWCARWESEEEDDDESPRDDDEDLDEDGREELGQVIRNGWAYLSLGPWDDRVIPVAPSVYSMSLYSTAGSSDLMTYRRTASMVHAAGRDCVIFTHKAEQHPRAMAYLSGGPANRNILATSPATMELQISAGPGDKHVYRRIGTELIKHDGRECMLFGYQNPPDVDLSPTDMDFAMSSESQSLRKPMPDDAGLYALLLDGPCKGIKVAIRRGTTRITYNGSRYETTGEIVPADGDFLESFLHVAEGK